MDRIVLRLRAAGSVFAEDEAAILVDAAAGAAPAFLESLVERRVAGEPVEHLVGSVRFGGLDLAVGPGVFVPRQRTAFLAETAADLAVRHDDALVVDLCCGCGAVGAVVRDRVPGVRLVAADVDPVAVTYARTNLPGVDVHVGDLFAALPHDLRGRIDVLAANVPYVPTSAIASMPPEARDHEPLATLDGGPDGLDVARRVATDAPDWLTPGGAFLLEVGEDQVDAGVRMLHEAGLEPEVREDDERGATVLLGRSVGS